MNIRIAQENRQFVGHAKATQGTFRKITNKYFMIEGIKPLLRFLKYVQLRL